MAQVSGNPTACAQHAQAAPFAAQLPSYFDNLLGDTCNIDIRNSNFTGNSRALYLDQLEQPVSVAESVFEGNQGVVEPGAGGAGGAIFMIGTFYAYITIIDCQFTPSVRLQQPQQNLNQISRKGQHNESAVTCCSISGGEAYFVVRQR